MHDPDPVLLRKQPQAVGSKALVPGEEPRRSEQGLWEPPAEAPDWLDRIDAPLVLVTASSEHQRDNALVETALQALRCDDVYVVATTLAHDPERFDVPANARVERWLPHGPVIQKAACVVCHGGMGITQRALAAGVPVCVVPFGRDQFEVAGRSPPPTPGHRSSPAR